MTEWAQVVKYVADDATILIFLWLMGRVVVWLLTDYDDKN